MSKSSSEIEHLILKRVGDTSTECSCGKTFMTLGEAKQHQWWSNSGLDKKMEWIFGLKEYTNSHYVSLKLKRRKQKVWLHKSGWEEIIHQVKQAVGLEIESTKREAVAHTKLELAHKLDKISDELHEASMKYYDELNQPREESNSE